MSVGGLGSRYHLFLYGIRSSIGDIFPYRSRKKPGLLQNHTKLLSEAFPGNSARIHSIYRNAPGIRVVKPHEQVDDGGFPTACGAHNGDAISRAGSHIHIFYKLLLRCIGKTDIMGFHKPSRIPKRPGVRCIRCFGLRIQQGENSFRSCKGRLHLCNNGGHLVEGFCILIGVGDKTGNLADSKGSRYPCHRADGTDHRNGSCYHSVYKPRAGIGKC